MNFIVQLYYRWLVLRSLITARWNVHEWTSDDARSLASFLESSPGKKLLVNLRNAALEASVRCCHAQPREIEKAAGFAQGYQASFATIMNLSAVRPPLKEADYSDVLRASGHNGATSMFYAVPDNSGEELLDG